MFLPLLVVLPVVSGFRSGGFALTDRTSVCLLSSYLEQITPRSTSAIKPGQYSISKSGVNGARQPASSYSAGSNTMTSPWPASPITSPLGNTPSPYSSGGVNGASQPSASSGIGSYIGNLSGPSSSIKPGAYSISKGNIKQPSNTGIGSYIGNLASGPSASYGSSATLSPPSSSSISSEPAGLGSYLDRLTPKSGAFKPGAYSISKGTPKQSSSTGIGSYIGNLASGSTSSPVQVAVVADEARARLESSINMMDSYLDNLAPKSGASYKPGKYSISKGIPKQPASTGIGSYISNLASSSSVMSAAEVKIVAQEARAKLERDISTMTSYIDNLSPQSSGAPVPGKYSISNSSYKVPKPAASLTMSSYLAHLSNTPMDIALLADEASAKVGDIMENTIGSTPAEKAIVELRKIVKALETIVELLEEMI